ncbi:MAG: hypothetical protein GXP27_14580 [Planctomycetes bacterium]|nr:hypothetical protein [Planctomycetota bacterium]
MRWSALTLSLFLTVGPTVHADTGASRRHTVRPGQSRQVTLNEKADGYRGIWYMNQPSHDQYVYKYSGGLGTYCAKHRPFAVYCAQVRKTFFCYGGTTADSNTHLLHMVSYFDHATGEVPRPTILLDKQTSDAHDNPVISVDGDGYIWVFSTSHGRSRPSYIHRSVRPYRIDQFEQVHAVRLTDSGPQPITNFSYWQVWYVPDHGFVCFFTIYGAPAKRTLFFATSRDGVTWRRWTCLAAIEEGHYQISAATSQKAGTAFNMHPRGRGLNWRTNLYYLESTDGGKTWQTVDGQPVEVPITDADSPCLVYDYRTEGLNVYLKDIRYDACGRPVILYLTSRGYQAGPQNDPRTWTIARWTGQQWQIRPAMTSDNNYDMGSLYLEPDGTWRIIAPTETGPQPYNPGGEVAMWVSRDEGTHWSLMKRLTGNSPRNHTYVRRPVHAHPKFYAFWADGHGRKPSKSHLYFCTKQGAVFMLPRQMKSDREKPRQLAP